MSSTSRGKKKTPVINTHYEDFNIRDFIHETKTSARSASDINATSMGVDATAADDVAPPKMTRNFFLQALTPKGSNNNSISPLPSPKSTNGGGTTTTSGNIVYNTSISPRSNNNNSLSPRTSNDLWAATSSEDEEDKSQRRTGTSSSGGGLGGLKKLFNSLAATRKNKTTVYNADYKPDDEAPSAFLAQSQQLASPHTSSNAQQRQPPAKESTVTTDDENYHSTSDGGGNSSARGKRVKHQTPIENFTSPNLEEVNANNNPITSENAESNISAATTKNASPPKKLTSILLKSLLNKLDSIAGTSQHHQHQHQHHSQPKLEPQQIGHGSSVNNNNNRVLPIPPPIQSTATITIPNVEHNDDGIGGEKVVIDVALLKQLAKTNPGLIRSSTTSSSVDVSQQYRTIVVPARTVVVRDVGTQTTYRRSSSSSSSVASSASNTARARRPSSSNSASAITSRQPRKSSDVHQRPMTPSSPIVMPSYPSTPSTPLSPDLLGSSFRGSFTENLLDKSNGGSNDQDGVVFIDNNQHTVDTTEDGVVFIDKNKQIYYTDATSPSNIQQQQSAFSSPLTTARVPTAAGAAEGPVFYEGNVPVSVGVTPRANEADSPVPDERNSSQISAEESNSTTGSPSQGSSDESTFFQWCRYNKYKELKTALENGTFDSRLIDIRDQHGNTGFIVAAQNGNKHVAKVLLRYGADIDAQNDRGQTALHYCFAYRHTALAEYFIAKGADKTIKNIYGLTCVEGLTKSKGSPTNLAKRKLNANLVPQEDRPRSSCLPSAGAADSIIRDASAEDENQSSLSLQKAALKNRVNARGEHRANSRSQSEEGNSKERPFSAPIPGSLDSDKKENVIVYSIHDRVSSPRGINARNLTSVQYSDKLSNSMPSPRLVSQLPQLSKLKNNLPPSPRGTSHTTSTTTTTTTADSGGGSSRDIQPCKLDFNASLETTPNNNNGGGGDDSPV